jgi:acyl carrier protein
MRSQWPLTTRLRRHPCATGTAKFQIHRDIYCELSRFFRIKVTNRKHFPRTARYRQLRGRRYYDPARETREKIIVLDRPQDDPARRVAALVHGFLAKRSSDRSVVGYDDELSASGLSSLDIVNLMLAVEAEFDLKIPDRKMTPSNFRSIACITELVQDLK